MTLFRFSKPMEYTYLSINTDLGKCPPKKHKKEHLMYLTNYKKTIGLEGKWYISEKLKGERVVWDGQNLLNVDLQKVPTPQSFLAKLPKKVPLDGVLMNYHPMERVCWNRVQFIVFDLPWINMPFDQRYFKLNALKEFKLFPNAIKLNPYTPIENIKENFDLVNQMYNDILERGGKGLMLTSSRNVYTGKSNTLLLYQKAHHGQAKIIGLIEGARQNYQRLGKFKCVTKEGKVFYCSKDIPVSIREKYTFRKTICTYIADDMPRIGDTLCYKSNELIKDNLLPHDPIYTGFILTLT